MISAQRLAFQFDANRCDGCHACQVGCTVENRIEWGKSWRTVYTFNPSRRPGLPVVHMSIGCNHCSEAPCMEFCPALAYSRHPTTGAVLLDSSKCMGCRFCSWQCPYGAPRFDGRGGVMRKCTFCSDRLLEGLDPACVAACPTGALKTTLNGLHTGTLPGWPDIGIGPAMKLVPLRAKRLSGADAADERCPTEDRAAQSEAAVEALRAEWPLVLFTLIAAGLVAVSAGAALFTLPIPIFWFLAAAAISMGLATMHLGNPLNAWRAVLNWRRSWLSREILLYNAFIAAAGATWLLAPSGHWSRWIAPALGGATLFSIDAIYRTKSRTGAPWLHSASSLLTGIFLTGILFSMPAIAIPSAFLKALAYVTRKRSRCIGPAWRIAAALRVAAGLLLAPALLGLGAPSIALALLSELIDRAEFYAELRFTSPGPPGGTA